MRKTEEASGSGEGAAMWTDGSLLKDTLLISVYSAMKLAEGANCMKLMKCDFVKTFCMVARDKM